MKWIILPGERVGRITKQASEADLIKIFGRGNVRQHDVYIGEGTTVSGTIVFPDQPNKKIEILWKDKQERKFPASVFIAGAKSLWKTDKGITLGTSLLEIEQLNGKPFHLAGFGWDYSGTILDCNQGELKELGYYYPENRARGLQGRKIIVRLGHDLRPGKEISNEEYRAVSGDRDFLSSHPVMQKLNPKVYQLIVEFDE